MDEKDDTKKEAGEKKAADAGVAKKADGGPVTIVLKLNLHCDGCAKKVKKSISHFEGVESVKADSVSNKLTVTGKVDPMHIKEWVEYKTKKKVEIISPQPKKDGGGGGGEKKADDKPSEKKSDDKKSEESQSTTVVLKILLHCDGCIHKIKRIISKIDGVESIIPDANNNLVTVKGTMNMKQLIPHLKEKLKRNVDIVVSKKEDNKGGEKKDEKKVEGSTDKKAKEGGNNGGDKKKNDEPKLAEGGGDGDEKKKKGEAKAVDGGGEKKSNDGEAKAVDGGGEKNSNDGEGKTVHGGGGGDRGKSVEVVNRSEYYRYNPYTYMMPVYNQNYDNQDYGLSVSYTHGYANEGYANHGYVMEYSHGPPLPPPPIYLHDPRGLDTEILSAENPNACSVM